MTIILDYFDIEYGQHDYSSKELLLPGKTL